MTLLDSNARDQEIDDVVLIRAVNIIRKEIFQKTIQIYLILDRFVQQASYSYCVSSDDPWWYKHPNPDGKNMLSKQLLYLLLLSVAEENIFPHIQYTAYNDKLDSPDLLGHFFT